jgi:hypothetical protein
VPIPEGETLGLELGFEGRSTRVINGGAVLLLAGGGEDQASNSISSTAEDVSSVPSGPGRFSRNGTVIIEWQIPEECVVPKLRGNQLPAARRLLRAARCRVGKVSRRPSRPGMRARVVSQSPLPGTVHPRGSRIDLTLGRRP